MELSTWLFRSLCTVGGFSGLVLALLYFFQDKLVYVPNIPGLAPEYRWTEPSRYKLAYEDVELQTTDKVKLHAWFLKLPHWDEEFTRKRPLIIFFQENAGNMSHRLPYLKLLLQQLQCPVLAPSYRGYGKSEGSPSQRGLMLDAEAVLAYARARPDVDASRIVLLGRSLGGAVALHLAAKLPHQVSGVVVENTFTAVEEMAARMLPPLGAVIGRGRPLNFLVRDKWNNRGAVAALTGLHLLLLSSTADEMVPPEQMAELRERARTASLDWVEFPGAYHMDAYHSHPHLYWPAFARFLQDRVGCEPLR